MKKKKKQDKVIQCARVPHKILKQRNKHHNIDIRKYSKWSPKWEGPYIGSKSSENRCISSVNQAM
jgi:hypothetical protein